MIKFGAGTQVNHAARTLLSALVGAYEGEVVAEFNGTPLVARVGDHEEGVVARWSDLREKPFVSTTEQEYYDALEDVEEANEKCRYMHSLVEKTYARYEKVLDEVDRAKCLSDTANIKFWVIEEVFLKEKDK